MKKYRKYYLFHFEDKINRDEPSYNKLEFLSKDFKTSGEEEKIIRFIKELPFQIKGFKRINRNILLKNNFFYGGGDMLSISNKNSHNILIINYYDKFHTDYLKKCAVSNLNYIVENRDLSLGERKIIKDVALDTLRNNLEIAGNKNEEIVYLSDIVRVDMSIAARQKLLNYGFKLKDKTIGVNINIITGQIQRVDYSISTKDFSGD